MALDDRGGAIVADFPEDFNQGLAALAAAENARRLVNYNRACDNAQLSIDAGRGDTVKWPTPPTRMEAIAAAADGVVQWMDLGHALVDPARQPLNKPQLPSGTGIAYDGSVDIGADLGGGWFAAGPHDKATPGTIVSTPLGRLQKVGAPVGNGWYLKIG